MAAIQRPSFSIYDASAGSGKTYTLVKEYLKIILTSPKDDAYRNILAITFTNKAVHEMKSRIVDSLTEFVKDQPAAKALQLMGALQSETGLSFAQIKTKSKQIIRFLIHNYAAFDISTIDKFTHKVIRAFAHDLNLPVTFEVTLDTENLLTEAVDALIAQAGEDETLTKLLVDFTMEKTDDDKSWDISREILEIGRLILNENNREEVVHFSDKSIPEFQEVKRRLTEAVKCIEGDCSDFSISALNLLDKHAIDHKSFSGGYFPNHLKSIREGKYNPNNKRYYEFEDIKINKSVLARDTIENIIPDLIAILADVYKNYEKRDFYNAFLKNITPLSLLNTISNELARIQKEQNVLSITEFNALIYREIQSQPAPFIYERLGERYRHFFIDEFQDTSEMQWQNLIPLIDNALSGQDDFGNKGTLMIVGDPKQSIYRWRGGKAEQFIELGKAHNPFNNPDKRHYSLDSNWRSYSQVVAFNNDFFEMLADEFEHSDYKDLYQNRSRQKENDKGGGYVNISFIPKTENLEIDSASDKKELYAAATLETIEKVRLQGFKLKDIVILTRKRDQGIAIANYLTAHKIPILSSETLMIGNASEVRFIIYLLRYLKNGNDLEAKAHFLYYAAGFIPHEMKLHDFISAGMALSDEKKFESWLASFEISLSLRSIRRKSLYETVEMIAIKFFGMPEGNAYVQYFLDIVLERDIRNQSGISDFLDYWERNSAKFSIPSPEGKDAVRIMTIHKSKGLEFPVVIMPFAEEAYAHKPKDKLWVETEHGDMGFTRALIDNSRSAEGFGPESAAVYGKKKQEELLDNINVLYVALTRAEEQLYVISAMNLNKNGAPKENEMSAFFIQFLIKKGLFEESRHEYIFGNPGKLSAQSEAAAAENKISPVVEILDSRNIRIAQREALMWGTKQQKSIEYGNIVHEILALVQDADDIDTAIFKAVEIGLVTLADKDVVQNTISRIVFHPDLKRYFSAGQLVLNEQTIIQKAGAVVKPDRMVLNQNKDVLLLDYKTGQHLSKHTMQIVNYTNAIESMGYRVVKKALVYIGENLGIVPL